MRVQINGNPDLVRDTHSMGIVNTNKQLFMAAQSKKLIELRTQNRLNNLEKEVKEIKTLLVDISSKLERICH